MVNFKKVILSLLAVGFSKVFGDNIPGYYKLDNSKYRQCTTVDCSEVDAINENCEGKADVGKLYKDTKDRNKIKLCSSVDSDFFFGISFGDSDKKYLIKHVKEGDNAFKFDREANYYVLAVSENAIVFDPIAEFEDLCALKSSGEVVDRKEDFCSSDSLGRYFTCKRGKCLLNCNQVMVKMNLMKKLPIVK